MPKMKSHSGAKKRFRVTKNGKIVMGEKELHDYTANVWQWLYVEANTLTGKATVKINGKKEVLSIDIQPEIVDPDDIETLSDILVAAVNEAIKRVETTNSSEMEKITKNVGFPGLF